MTNDTYGYDAGVTLPDGWYWDESRKPADKLPFEHPANELHQPTAGMIALQFDDNPTSTPAIGWIFSSDWGKWLPMKTDDEVYARELRGPKAWIKNDAGFLPPTLSNNDLFPGWQLDPNGASIEFIPKAWNKPESRYPTNKQVVYSPGLPTTEGYIWDGEIGRWFLVYRDMGDPKNIDTPDADPPTQIGIEPASVDSPIYNEIQRRERVQVPAKGAEVTEPNRDTPEVLRSREVEMDLTAWWETTAAHDLAETIPKAIAYGSESMVDFGRSLASLAGRRDIPEAEALEWAIFAYLEGKMGRWRAKLKRGERCDADTLKDIDVYATMARKVQDTGHWT